MRSFIKDPVSEIKLKNKKKGVSGLASRKFSLIPPEDNGVKNIGASNSRLKLPMIPNKAVAAKSDIPKGVRHKRRYTEPAALNIDQFANFLQGGEW